MRQYRVVFWVHISVSPFDVCLNRTSPHLVIQKNAGQAPPPLDCLGWALAQCLCLLRLFTVFVKQDATDKMSAKC